MQNPAEPLPNPRPIVIAALPREISAVVKGWRAHAPQRNIHVFEHENAIAACAGMGANRARAAVEAALALGPASELISAGYAGACQPSLAVGQALWADIVIDAQTGERFFTEAWHEVFGDLARARSRADGNDLAAPVPEPRILVTVPVPAGVQRKRYLSESYGADAVDMEAAAVARIARARDLPFTAIKAISDAHDFELPGMERFSTAGGQFREAAFALHAAFRPRMWSSVLTLAKGSTLASEHLCAQIQTRIQHLRGQTR